MSKQKGLKCKLYIVDSDDPLTPKVLAAQKSTTLNRSAETLDATSKDSEWKENLAGMKEWSIDADGCLIESDVAYGILETKFNSGENVDVVIIMESGTEYRGNAVITDFPIDMPYDDLVTYSISLVGNGELTKTTNP